MRTIIASVLRALAVITIGLFASAASAACGDDVGGTRIPCRCGDVVVSDTELLSGDPIVSEACLADGLVVRARDGAESIHLNLNGLTVQGSGFGIGIRVIDGGSRGAVISGGSSGAFGTITGFRVGISARGRKLLASLSAVAVSDNRSDGAAIAGQGVNVVDLAATNNGRDGLRLGGRRSRATNVRTVANAAYGIRVTGRGNHVESTSVRDVAGASVMTGRDQTSAITRLGERSGGAN